MKTSLGATYYGDGRCRFMVWAPLAERVEVRLVSPHERVVPLERYSQGYHRAVLDDCRPPQHYVYRLFKDQASDPIERPDPASRCQPEGVHGPSQVVEPHFDWEDADWHGLPLTKYIIYELHVGTFTPEGTFDAAVDYLDELKELGITAVELMPVAQFPGARNWGYDGVYPFAVQNSYGGPQGLKRLVNACHLKGLAVILDVVYNHLGPEGNYLRDFGPYLETSALISRISTGPPGERPSILTGLTATTSGGISLKMRFTGLRIVTSMPCALMRCMPYWTFPPDRFWRHWHGRFIARPND